MYVGNYVYINKFLNSIEVTIANKYQENTDYFYFSNYSKSKQSDVTTVFKSIPYNFKLRTWLVDFEPITH